MWGEVLKLMLKAVKFEALVLWVLVWEVHFVAPGL